MKGGLQSTEFWFGCLVVVCATALLLTEHITEDTWKWAVATVGGAYVLGRSLVKAADARGTPTNVSNVYDSHATPVSTTVNTSTGESKTKVDDPGPLQGVDAIRDALERNAEALSSLQKDLSL